MPVWRKDCECVEVVARPPCCSHDREQAGRSAQVRSIRERDGTMEICRGTLSCSSQGHLSVLGNISRLLLIPNHLGGDWTFIAATRGAEGAIEMQEPLVASFTDPADRGAARDLTQGPFAGARPFRVLE